VKRPLHLTHLDNAFAAAVTIRNLVQYRDTGSEMIHSQIRLEGPMINRGDNQFRNFRSRRRYDHASILLWVKVNDSGPDWKRIRVHDWNEKGFNFHLDWEIGNQDLRFRKGTSEFSGNLIWTLRNDNESAILEIILNNALVRALKRFPDNGDLIGRALSMVRTEGLLDEKKKLLAHIGCEISSEDESLLIQSYRMKYPCYRYGIGVESSTWSEIVKHVLDLTSVVGTLDQLDIMMKSLRSVRLRTTN